MLEKFRNLKRTNLRPVELSGLVSQIDLPKNSETISAVAISPDYLADLTKNIESISSEDQALSRADQLRAIGALTKFEIGGILGRIKRENWLGGYGTFSDLCEKRFGMSERKARYLINTYNWVIKAQLTGAQVGTVAWTKMRLLPGKIDPSEAVVWVDKARQLTVLELKDELALLKQASSSEENPVYHPPLISDQSQFEKPKTALACTNPVSGEAAVVDGISAEQFEVEEEIRTDKKLEAAIDWMQEVGPEAVLKTFREVFPDVKVTTHPHQKIPANEG